ncbi:MAG TPA: hypothetical protein DEB39_03745 [Planctomycetaceae bacterium]|nr:hypothetical protein [Planctomycetaceae bacterium]
MNTQSGDIGKIKKTRYLAKVFLFLKIAVFVKLYRSRRRYRNYELYRVLLYRVKESIVRTKENHSFFGGSFP